MNFKTDFSKKECEILVKICNLKKIRNLDYCTLTRNIKEDAGSINFQNVKNYLKQIKIINETGFLGKSILIEIDYKKVEDLIEKQDYVNWWVYNYFLPKKHIILWR